MKFIIKPVENEFRVTDESGQIVFGCHDKKELAEEQQQSMEASHNNGQLYELRNVHIFNVGKWNGKDYTVEDLDQIVAAFAEQGYRPPVKLGHADDDSAPAYGWVKAIKRTGEGLFADFMDLPETVYNAIKDRRYDVVSSEIFFNLKRGGKTFARALKAVALLGSAIPGVNLRPLRESFTADKGDAVIFSHKLNNEDLEMPRKNLDINPDDFKFVDLAGAKKVVDDLIAKFKAAAEQGDDQDPEVVKLAAALEKSNSEIAKLTEQNRKKDIDAKVTALRVPAYRPFIRQFYDLATRANAATEVVKFGEAGKETEITLAEFVDKLVGKLNKDTEILFQTVANHASDLIPEGHEIEGENAGKVVDARAKKYMADQKSDDYMAAVKFVLDSDPELKAAYHTKATAE